MSEEVNQLLNRMLDRENELSPVSATFKGIHEHDEDWDDPSPEGFAEFEDYIKEYSRLIQQELEIAKEEDMTELKLAKARLAGYSILWNRMEYLKFNPMNVPNTVIDAIFIMMVREYEPIHERLDTMLARLGKVPAYCHAARPAITKVVDRYSEMALEIIEYGGAFLTKIIPDFARKAGYSHLDRLQTAADKAAVALTEYGAYIKSLPSVSNFAIGREAFDDLLKENHLLGFDAVHLLAFGQEQLDRVQQSMKDLAEKIKPGSTPEQIIDEAKSNHPSAEGLLDYYRMWMAKTRQFVIDKNLCGMPPDEELEIIETPTFERSTIPYAAYMSPAPYELLQKGFFYVTPLDDTLSPEEKAERLQGHNSTKVPIIALHEGYPGHHLQLCWANQTNSRIRRECDSTVFAEGWALYCEEMMKEQGFYTDDRMVLSQLNDVQWRAARVILDVSLHTGSMSFDEAVSFLMEKARLERLNAEAEVKRYIYTPTQPMSYLVGKHEVLRMREDFFHKHPAASLRDFHDRLLAQGTLPISVVREAVLA